MLRDINLAARRDSGQWVCPIHHQNEMPHSLEKNDVHITNQTRCVLGHRRHGSCTIRSFSKAHWAEELLLELQPKVGRHPERADGSRTLGRLKDILITI